MRYILLLTLLSSLANAGPTEVYRVNGKASTKAEALKAITAKPNTEVIRCRLAVITPEANAYQCDQLTKDELK